MGETPTKTKKTVDWPARFRVINMHDRVSGRKGCIYCKTSPHPVCSRCGILLHATLKKHKCKSCQDHHGNISAEVPSLCCGCAKELTKQKNRAILSADDCF